MSFWRFLVPLWNGNDVNFRLIMFHILPTNIFFTEWGLQNGSLSFHIKCLVNDDAMHNEVENLFFLALNSCFFFYAILHHILENDYVENIKHNIVDCTWKWQFNSIERVVWLKVQRACNDSDRALKRIMSNLWNKSLFLMILIKKNWRKTRKTFRMFRDVYHSGLICNKQWSFNFTIHCPIAVQTKHLKIMSQKIVSITANMPSVMTYKYKR